MPNDAMQIVETLLPTAIQVSNRVGNKVLPQTIIAMALTESHKGKGTLSGLAANHNNYFGIKCGSSWPYKKVNLKTFEIVNGKRVEITDCFRAYDNFAQSAADFVSLITRSKRYESALDASNAAEQIALIQKAGYSTNPNYIAGALPYIALANQAMDKYYTKQAFLVIGATIALALFI
jgi:flagellar protein FlgJ